MEVGVIAHKRRRVVTLGVMVPLARSRIKRRLVRASDHLNRSQVVPETAGEGKAPIKLLEDL
jgi:hypothetical protein